MKPYFTILIPWVPPGHNTEWHPEDPAVVLTRGCFPNREAAIEWARQHLNGTPYSLRYEEANQ